MTPAVNRRDAVCPRLTSFLEHFSPSGVSADHRRHRCGIISNTMDSDSRAASVDLLHVPAALLPADLA